MRHRLRGRLNLGQTSGHLGTSGFSPDQDWADNVDEQPYYVLGGQTYQAFLREWNNGSVLHNGATFNGKGVDDAGVGAYYHNNLWIYPFGGSTESAGANANMFNNTEFYDYWVFLSVSGSLG